MKLILIADRIAALATDDYTGPDPWVTAPDDFDPADIDRYRLVDGLPVMAPPAIVSMRQARLALLAGGMLAQVNAAVAAMPGTEGEAARIEWEYATEVRLDSPLVAGLAAALGLDAAALDQLFVSASRL